MSSELMETESSGSMALDKKSPATVKKPPPQQEVVRGHTFQVNLKNTFEIILEHNPITNNPFKI